MGVYRQIHTKIWKDGWFLDLEPDLKLLFIYLFSNERANLAGLYDIPLKVISFETDLPTDRIQEGLEVFRQAGKAFYEDGWLWMPNLLRYNAQNITSIKIQTHLHTALNEIPDMPLKQRWIEHYNGIVSPEYHISAPDTLSIGYDTVSIPDPKEQEQEQDKDKDQEQEQSSPPTEGADAPTNLDDWLSLVGNAKNKPAAVRFQIDTLFPNWKPPPEYSYIGRAIRTVKGETRLTQLLWQAAGQRITGDPLAYAMGIAKGQKTRDGPNQNIPELEAYQ